MPNNHRHGDQILATRSHLARAVSVMCKEVSSTIR